MASTTDLVRSKIDIKPTPMNKGVEVELKLALYDNGILSVNGVPLGGQGGSDLDPRQAVAEVCTFLSISLERLMAAARKRQEEQQTADLSTV